MSDWKHLGAQSQSVIVLQDGDVLVGRGPGISRSSDKGKTWRESGIGMDGRCGDDAWVTCFAACSSAVLAGTAKCGVFRSTDGGRNWNLITAPPDVHFDYHDIQFHPLECNVIWAIGNDWDNVKLYRSRDGAATWTPIGVTANDREITIYRMSLDPVDPATIYVGTTGLILMSKDFGDSWKVILEDPELAGIPRIAHDPSQRGHLYIAGLAGGSVVIRESVDGGTTFKPIQELRADTYQISDLIYDHIDRTLFVATSKGVYQCVE